MRSPFFTELVLVFKIYLLFSLKYCRVLEYVRRSAWERAV